MQLKKQVNLLLMLVAVMMISLSFSPISFDDNKESDLKEWERAKVYTKEYLDAAKEETFSFKPTPEMRTFAEQMKHLAEVNYAFAATASGKTSPYKFGEIEKGPLKSKAEVTKAVLDSYDFMIAAIKSIDESKMNSSIKMFNMDMTVQTALDKAFEHQTHHRGQTTVYLRLAGVTPPQEKLF